MSMHSMAFRPVLAAHAPRLPYPLFQRHHPLVALIFSFEAHMPRAIGISDLKFDQVQILSSSWRARNRVHPSVDCHAASLELEPILWMTRAVIFVIDHFAVPFENHPADLVSLSVGD